MTQPLIRASDVYRSWILAAPKIAKPPQLVLDRAPTPQELCRKRQELYRDRRVCIGDKLVCSIPVENVPEVMDMGFSYFRPVHWYSDAERSQAEENEIGQLVGWRIVFRYPE